MEIELNLVNHCWLTGLLVNFSGKLSTVLVFQSVLLWLLLRVASLRLPFLHLTVLKTPYEFWPSASASHRKYWEYKRFNIFFWEGNVVIFVTSCDVHVFKAFYDLFFLWQGGEGVVCVLYTAGMNYNSVVNQYHLFYDWQVVSNVSYKCSLNLFLLLVK